MIRGSPKGHHKYTLGTDLRNKSRQIVSLVVKTNSGKEKLPGLLELWDQIEELLIINRICKEAKAFKSFRAFSYIEAYS